VRYRFCGTEAYQFKCVGHRFLELERAGSRVAEAKLDNVVATVIREKRALGSFILVGVVVIIVWGRVVNDEEKVNGTSSW